MERRTPKEGGSQRRKEDAIDVYKVIGKIRKRLNLRLKERTVQKGSSRKKEEYHKDSSQVMCF